MTTVPMSSTDRNYTPALTGLRGFAAAWVFAYHAWQFSGGHALVIGPIDLTPLFAGGYYGVDLFFVLSGFLIGRPFLLARMHGQAMPSLRTFWTHRLRRVFPAYLVQLGILLAIVGVLEHAEPLSVGRLFGHLTLTFNLVENDSVVNPVYWSLPVEWDFYIVLPLLALGFWRQQAIPWIVPAMLGFAIGFRILCWQLLFVTPPNGDLFRWTLQLPARIDQLVIGMMAAWIALHWPGLSKRRSRFCVLVGTILLLACVWVSVAKGDDFDPRRLPWAYFAQTLAAIAFACLIYAAASGSQIMHTIFGNPALRWLGTISFSLYLWHWIILNRLQPLHLATTTMLAIAIAGSLAVAWLSWRFVERPCAA
ncbi:MAG: acyltransferase, partial [Dokdonella sp.]